MTGLVRSISRITSLIGGTILVGLTVLTCLSVAGRMLNSFLHLDGVQMAVPRLANRLIETGIGPITGDYELLEAGMACVIFAFLPLCQLQSGHASVNIFTDRLPKKIRAILICIAESSFALALILIAWQLGNGLGDKYRSHETTSLLEMPVWYGYAAALLMAYAAAFVALAVAYYRCMEQFFGWPNKLREQDGKP